MHADVFLGIFFWDIIAELVLLHVHAKCKEPIRLVCVFIGEIFFRGE